MYLSKPFSLKLPRIRCRCGAEILVVPNVELMSKAIEEHAETHQKQVQGTRAAEAEAQRVREELTIKVLQAICKT